MTSQNQAGAAGQILINGMSHAEFLEKVLAFHGHAAPGVIIGGYMVELARRSLPEGVLFDAISETGQCLPDAIQMLTPCTIGNGWLRIIDLGIYALALYDKHTGAGVRVSLDAARLDKFPHTKGWFLKEIPKKEQDSDGIKAEMASNPLEMLTVQKIGLKPEVLERKSKGAIRRCPECGVAYPAILGQICGHCQGRSPYLSLKA